MGAIKENLIYNIENIVNKMDELGLFDYEEAENEALFEDIQEAIMNDDTTALIYLYQLLDENKNTRKEKAFLIDCILGKENKADRLMDVAINYQMDQEKIYNMVYDQMIKNFFKIYLLLNFSLLLTCFFLFWVVIHLKF